jgi:hypothetical protein
VRLKDLRVNDAGTDDVMPGSSIASELAARMGYDDSLITASLNNALPMDQIAGSWSDLLDRIAVLDDYRWLVLDDAGLGPRLDYGPWAREWILYSATAEWSGLVPIELHNRVRVRYQTAAGTPSDVVVDAVSDPLEGTGLTNVYEYALEGVQTDDALATGVANLLLARVSTRRYAGPVHVLDAHDARGRSVYEILPGDIARLTDFAPAASHQGRIYEVTYSAAGVTLGIEAPADVTSILAAFAGAAARSAVALPSVPDVGGF